MATPLTTTKGMQDGETTVIAPTYIYTIIHIGAMEALALVSAWAWDLVVGTAAGDTQAGVILVGATEVGMVGETHTTEDTDIEMCRVLIIVADTTTTVT